MKTSVLCSFAAAFLLVQPCTAAPVQFEETGNLLNARDNQNAILLQNGKVLVAFGRQLQVAELYDPATGTWTATGASNSPHDFATATLLPNGKVLVAGGEDPCCP